MYTKKQTLRFYSEKEKMQGKRLAFPHLRWAKRPIVKKDEPNCMGQGQKKQSFCRHRKKYKNTPSSRQKSNLVLHDVAHRGTIEELVF
jgi:hypothetical protein